MKASDLLCEKTNHHAQEGNMTEDRWAQPADIDRAQIAFGSGALDYMPTREECEAALLEMKDRGRRWRALQTEWFFRGLPKGTEFIPVEGVDKTRALGHLAMIQGSFDPKHEHKEAAVAYLMSRWFKDVKVAKRPKVDKAKAA